MDRAQQDPSPSTSPETSAPAERFTPADLSACLRPFLWRLTPLQEEALRLVDIDCLPLQDASARAGLDLAGFKGRLGCARKHILAGFKDCILEEGEPRTRPRDPNEEREIVSPEERLARFKDQLRTVVAPWVAGEAVESLVLDVLRTLREDAPTRQYDHALPRRLYAIVRGALSERLAREGRLPPLARLALTYPERIGPAQRQALALCLAPFIEVIGPKQMEAVRMADLEGVAQQRAAVALGVPVLTFKARLWKGRSGMLVAFHASRIEAERSGTGRWARFAAHVRDLLAPWIEECDLDRVLRGVLLRLEREAGERRDTEAMVPWVYAVVRDALLTHLGRTGSAPLLPPLPCAPSEAPDPACRALLATCIAPFVAGLTAAQAESFILVDVDGNDTPVVARRLGVHVTIVRSRLERARTGVRAAIESCCRAAEAEGLREAL